MAQDTSNPNNYNFFKLSPELAMENENNFKVVSSLREDDRLWLIVGLKIYAIEKAENALYRSDQSLDTLNSEGTVQCLKIQFLHDM